MKSILERTDICCIQEHWLFKSEQYMLQELSTTRMVTAKSIDEEQPELSMIARRGYGGIAVFWKKELDDKIHVLDEGSARIQAIRIETDTMPICLVNVYMPADNKEMDIEYKDTLAQLTEVIQKYRNTHEVILCGDMNGSMYRQKTPHDILFKKFLSENNIELHQSHPEKNTFYHHNGKSTAQIDYILSTTKHYLEGISILDMDPRIHQIMFQF